MKSQLWCVFAVCLVLNVAANLLPDALPRIAFSVVTGLAVLGSGVRLYLLRGRRS